METSNVLCESCKKPFQKGSILNHIGHSDICKSYYGPRFIEMKKKKQNEKKQQWRELNKEKELENQRRLYAESSEKKEKKRQNYEKKQSNLAEKEGWTYVSTNEYRKKQAELIQGYL